MQSFITRQKPSMGFDHGVGHSLLHNADGTGGTMAFR